MTASEVLGERKRNRNSLRALLLALLAAGFLGRIVATYWVFNNTTDEPAHIMAGVEYLQHGIYSFEPQHPPLARLVIGLLPYCLGGLRVQPGDTVWGPDAWGRGERTYYWITLGLARAGTLVFAGLLLFFIHRWSHALYGPWAALAATALVACCPNLIAHSSLATLDMAAASTTLMAAYCFWRWGERPGWGHCLAAAIAFGLAVLSKFSALVFLPPLAVLYFVIARWRLWRQNTADRFTKARAGLTRAAFFLLLAAFVVWAGYRFETGTLVPHGHRYRSPFLAGHGSHGLAGTLTRVIDTKTVPAPRFWQGLIDLLSHNEHGHLSYLLGRLSSHGWWYYFPVTVALKTTLPMLLLAGMAAGVCALRKTDRPAGTAYLILPILVILVASAAASINIGVRHVLAVYPFFAILASGLFRESSAGPGSLRRAVPLGLLLWHGTESLRAHPDYLAYFNQIARGREERFLADSNLDWGQDLARLSRYLREHRIENVQLSYFGVSRPALLGIQHSKAPCCREETGWIAVSVNHLVGIGEGAGQAVWLRGRPPDVRIGKSIWLFLIRSPERR